jgi:hypothetical protein
MRLPSRGNVFTESFPGSDRIFLLIKIFCLAANIVSLFVSWSLPRNGSIRHSNKELQMFSIHLLSWAATLSPLEAAVSANSGSLKSYRSIVNKST